MSELEKDQNNVAERELVLEKFDAPAEVLDSALAKLVKVGGFDFLEASVDGVENLNPERKARKKIFLSESDKKTERVELKKKLLLWVQLIQESTEIGSMIESCSQKSEAASKLLKKNLKKALNATNELETNYRSLALFYKNTESDKLKNVTIMNASLDQMKDLDNTRFIDYITDELKSNYDRLDLRDNYSIMVIPGYLGSNKVVEKWSKIAYDNKVMMVTDFANLDTPDDVIDMFDSANLSGGDIYKSNCIMACNWLVGRGKNTEVGEEEDIMVAPSSALAGKIYTTLMSQVTAGKKHGGMSEVDAVKFDLRKSEIAQLEKAGLVPMVNEYGKVLAFSAKTLFNGDNLGLQTYSVVRVFDYITKVLIDFLNRRAFENWTSNTERDLRLQIVQFLDSIKGPSSLIEKFSILRLEQDENQKDKIHVDIHITPYFPAKNFLVKLDGQKGDDATAWEASYNQQ